MSLEVNSAKLEEEINGIVNSASYSILNAQKDFDASSLKLLNPQNIHEEIVYQKEIFSKLKFLYLEQETRDKFLRKVSEVSAEEIDGADLEKAEDAAVVSKKNLHDLKARMYQQIEVLDTVATDNTRLYDTYTRKVEVANELVAEIRGLEADLDELMKDSVFENPQIVAKIASDHGNSVEDVDQLVRRNETELEEHSSELQRLIDDIELKKLLNVKQLQHIHSSKSKLEELKLLVSNQENPVVNPADDKLQNYAKWCHEMNGIIIRFTNIKSLKLRLAQDSNFVLSMKHKDEEVQIVYDELFHVVDVTGIVDTDKVEQFKRITNSHSTISEETFLTETVKFLNSTILQKSS